MQDVECHPKVVKHKRLGPADFEQEPSQRQPGKNVSVDNRLCYVQINEKAEIASNASNVCIDY